MNEEALAPMHSWLVAPMDDEVSKAIRRLQRAPDVQRVAVMPDVHLAEDVCVGVSVATTELLYPQAVGGDIGCGMLAIPFDLEAAAISEPRTAGRVLASLGNSIPARRRNRREAIAMPAELAKPVLSDSRLQSLWNSTGVLEFATIGSGNHFVELQAEEPGRLWLMVHSGSRGLGPAIRDHHLARGQSVGGGLKCLMSGQDIGDAYLRDAGLARRFACENRRQIALLVEEALHGAGRILSRTEARRTITTRELQRQMGDVWYDFRLSERLRDEAPGAYKDIRAVVRAQGDLVRVVRVVRPVLNYKGA